MTIDDARIVLGLGTGLADREATRLAYLARVQGATLDVDPRAFMRLRAAYEQLRRDGTVISSQGGMPSSVDQVDAARARLDADPDSNEARWTLLSLLHYGEGPEARAVLRQGAERADPFLDELMLHFPEEVSAILIDRACNRGGVARLLLVADVHATAARPAEALRIMRTALVGAEVRGPASQTTLALALRPVFSLHFCNLVAVASDALSLVEPWVASATSNANRLDTETETLLGLARELGRMDPTFPLEFRQVAARAAKLGRIQNAAYEARFATRLLTPRAIRKWRKRLPSEAPVLAKLLGLDLTEDQLRPEGTPNFRIAAGWAVAIAANVLILAWRMHAAHWGDDDEKTTRQFLNAPPSPLRLETELEACAEPSSDKCREWWENVNDVPLNLRGKAASAGPTTMPKNGAPSGLTPPPGLEDLDLGRIGTSPPDRPSRRKNGRN